MATVASCSSSSRVDRRRKNESFSRSHELRNSTSLQTKTRPPSINLSCRVRHWHDVHVKNDSIPATFRQLIREKMTNTCAGATLSRLCLPVCLSVYAPAYIQGEIASCGPLEPYSIWDPLLFPVSTAKNFVLAIQSHNKHNMHEETGPFAPRPRHRRRVCGVPLPRRFLHIFPYLPIIR